MNIKGLTLTKNRNLLSILLTSVVFLLVYTISISNLLYIFDKKIQDLYFLFNDINVTNELVVVEIDEDTLSGRQDNLGNTTLEGLGRFPFDRKYYANVIDNLSSAGASVIALDIIFGEKSNSISDDLLANSIKNAGNVVLGLWTDSDGTLKTPYEKFNKNIISSGYYAPNVDKTTQVVYGIRPFAEFRGTQGLQSHFALSVLKAYYYFIYKDPSYLSLDILSSEEKYILGDKIELLKSREGKNEVLINYTDSYKFNKISFLDVYNNQFNHGDFKDKIVLIGATAKGIKDVFNTPLGSEYGVYTHANMINTIITKNGIKYFDEKLEWFLIFLLILISVYFNISKSSYVLIFSNIAIVSIFVLGVLYITVLTNILLNYSVELALALLLSLAVSNIVKYLVENKHKTRLNKALSEYVSVDVANEILSGEGRVNLNGENKKIAIFFSDIQGFTSISERFSPEELVGFLREYLSEMSNIIMDEKGFINKYEGDAIMALWGVFGDNKVDTYNICKAALKQQEALEELNKSWKKRGFDNIKARIGMHIGNAIIGNIGSEGRKMEFTALGDSVNLASRLEGVNKFYGTYICVSEDIYNLEKDNFEFRYLDKIRVKGKEVPIKIYELLGFKGKLDKQTLEIRDLFEQATKLYTNRKFKEAKTIFSKLVKMGDKAPTIYIDMCEIYMKNPPSDDWDGVSTMTSK